MFQKGIPKTFIGFLIASFFIWLLNTFSKEYYTTLPYELHFENLPQDMILEATDSYTLNLQVKATGFKIIRSRLRNTKLGIDAAYIQSKKHDSHYVLVKQVKPEIQKQLISGMELLTVDQDSIFIGMGVLSSKKIPLEPNLDIKFHKGYELLEELHITPDSILIYGSNDELLQITSLQLTKVSLKDVKESFTKEVSIELPKEFQHLEISDTKALIKGKVDKFTEGKIRIPITITNLPQGVDLTMLTDEVEITYIVALSNFSNVVDSSFKVVCDYNLAIENKLDHLVPKLTKRPTFLKSYKMSPHKIDFLIKK